MKFPRYLLLAPIALGSFLFTGCDGGSANDASETAAPAEAKFPDSPAEAMEMVAKELAAGNGGILWEAMPTSYRSDVNAIAQLAGGKVDAEVYNKVFGLIGRLAEVANKQKAFILGTEMMGAQDPAEVAKMEAAWPSVMGFVETITSSSIGSAEGLKSFDGQAFCDSTVSTLIKYSEDLSAISGEELPISAYRGVSIKELERTETTATLEMTGPDGAVEVEAFSKVDDRWVPTEVAADWAENIGNAKSQLEAMSPEEMAQNKPQIMSVMAMLDGVLTQIEAAETQEQFDRALQGAMMPIMGLMMMQQGMGGGAAPSMPVAPPAQ